MRVLPFVVLWTQRAARTQRGYAYISTKRFRTCLFPHSLVSVLSLTLFLLQLKLLQAAVKKHVRLMRAATNGDGVDRHLLGLRVLAAATGQQPEIFTDKAYQLKFKLSTSQ